MTSDLAPTDRAALIDVHIIHPFDTDLARRNLKGAYGKLIRRRYERMLPLLIGKRVLDGGCGIGLFSSVCAGASIHVTSVDLDTVSLQLARELYGVEARPLSVYDTGLAGDSIDAIVLFDVIQHLDFEPLFKEMKRLGVSRTLVYDSNVANPILGWHRRRMGHQEHREYTKEDVVRAFRGAGFELVKLECENSVMLPATGGLQRDPMPILRHLPWLILALDATLTSILRILRLDQRFCFRYFAVFDRVQ